MKKEKIIIIINVFLLIAAVTFSVLFGVTLSQKNTLQANYDELNTKYEELEKTNDMLAKVLAGICVSANIYSTDECAQALMDVSNGLFK